MNFQIRKMNKEDLEEISKDLIMYDEFWNKNILESEFKNENSEYFVLIDYSKIIAFAGILVGVDSCEIMNIAVNKEFRRTGYGSKMLKYLYNEVFKDESTRKEVFSRKYSCLEEFIYEWTEHESDFESILNIAIQKKEERNYNDR